MGCYGLGITRLVAAIVEQRHDDRGICWPPAVAPADVHVVALNYPKSDGVRAAADRLYDELGDAGFVVLLDDRAERPGVKFADADLIGLPHRITVGDRHLADGRVEYRRRTDSEDTLLALDDVSVIEDLIDKTVEIKPRKNPKITGYAGTGDRSKYDQLRARLGEMTGEKE